MGKAVRGNIVQTEDQGSPSSIEMLGEEMVSRKGEWKEPGNWKEVERRGEEGAESEEEKGAENLNQSDEAGAEIEVEKEEGEMINSRSPEAIVGVGAGAEAEEEAIETRKGQEREPPTVITGTVASRG